MRPFTDVLGELGAGQTLDTLTVDLTDVVNAVKATGKPGDVTLKLTVRPNGAYGVAILDKITTKVPKEDRGETLFFTDNDGGLHRRDPRQEELPLRQVRTADHQPETGEAS